MTGRAGDELTPVDYRKLVAKLSGTALEPWLLSTQNHLLAQFSAQRHGDYPRWLEALKNLAEIKPERIVLNEPAIAVQAHIDGATQSRVEHSLRLLHPWRKGPFDIHGTYIDAEWRSDWKWARLEHAIQPLQGRRVLDVGCGSGYYCWRMAGAGAKLAMGIDPSLLFVMQFLAIQHFVRDERVWVLPCRLEDLPTQAATFDSIFSMGVLYHRKSPLDHLTKLHGLLCPGGELILETLVLDKPGNHTLNPTGRYARMRNVHAIPTPDMLKAWLKQAYFTAVTTIDLTATTVEEQRTTDWMRFESLRECLHPTNTNFTIEGHPAPLRAILTARKP